MTFQREVILFSILDYYYLEDLTFKTSSSQSCLEGNTGLSLYKLSLLVQIHLGSYFYLVHDASKKKTFLPDGKEIGFFSFLSLPKISDPSDEVQRRNVHRD